MEITDNSSDKSSAKESSLRILSFNCKNVKTTAPFFKIMENRMDIILLQEHWLYHYELDLLNEIHSDFKGIGKAVDIEHQSIGKNTMEEVMVVLPSCGQIL